MEPSSFSAPDSKTVLPARSRMTTCSQARREGYGVGSLCPRKILYEYIDVELSLTGLHIAKAHTGALRLKEVHRLLRGGV